MEPLVLYDKRDSVAWITLNRPRALNAVNLAMRDELWDAFLAVRDDPDVRVAVIAGAGSAPSAPAPMSRSSARRRPTWRRGAPARSAIFGG